MVKRFGYTLAKLTNPKKQLIGLLCKAFFFMWLQIAAIVASLCFGELKWGKYQNPNGAIDFSIKMQSFLILKVSSCGGGGFLSTFNLRNAGSALVCVFLSVEKTKTLIFTREYRGARIILIANQMGSKGGKGKKNNNCFFSVQS